MTITPITQNELINTVSQVETIAKDNAYNVGNGLTSTNDTYFLKKVSFSNNKPDLNNGVASNFRSSSSEADGYLAGTNVLKGKEYDSFEIVTRFNYVYNTSFTYYEQSVFGCTNDTAFNDTKMGLWISMPFTNKSDYRIRFTFKAENNSVVTLTSNAGVFNNNQWYWLKVTYDSTTGYAYYLSNDGESWSLVNSSAITDPLDDSWLGDSILWGCKNPHGRFPLNKELDLNNTYIKIDGQKVWYAYDPNQKEISSSLTNSTLNTTSLGLQSKPIPVSSEYAIAIGNQADVRDDSSESIAIGPNASVEGAGSIAIGKYSSARYYASGVTKAVTSVGYLAGAVGDGSTAIGSNSYVDECWCGTAIGYNAYLQSGSDYSIQLGQGMCNEPKSLYIGFGNDDNDNPLNYKLLIGRDGTIPKERLVRAAPQLSNIAVPGNNIQFTTGVNNYGLVGTPTILNGIASNFSTSDYITANTTPFNNSSNITVFELYTKFKLPTGNESGPLLFNNLNSDTSNPGFLLSVNNSGHLYAELNTDDEHSPLTAETDETLEADTDYWVKVKWNEYGYGSLAIFISTDGINYDERGWSWYSGYSLNTFDSTFAVGATILDTSSSFSGTIDLSQTYAIVNDEEVWRAYDLSKTVISSTGGLAPFPQADGVYMPKLTIIGGVPTITWVTYTPVESVSSLPQQPDNNTVYVVTGESK